MALYYQENGKYYKKDVIYSNTEDPQETTIELKRLPKEVREAFDSGKKEYGELPAPPNSDKLSPKSCIFCRSYTKYTRFVNGQVVYICEEHYHSKNIGQIAQQLRSIKNGED